MLLSERIMQLKGKTYYTTLEAISGVKAAVISKIARGIITDPPIQTIIHLAEAFHMSIMRLMAPVHEYRDSHIIMQTRRKVGNEWHVFTEARV